MFNKSDSSWMGNKGGAKPITIMVFSLRKSNVLDLLDGNGLIADSN